MRSPQPVARHEEEGITVSFTGLRALADDFAALGAAGRATSAAHRRALKLVTSLGATSIPLLARKLHHGGDGEATWAYQLLLHVAAGALRARVITAAHGVALDDALADARKALALALLSELGSPLPDVQLADPKGLREKSVRDLIATLVEPADVARAADLLLDQVADGDLPQFVAELVEAGGGAVGPVIDELLLRDDVSLDAMADLRELRRGLVEEGDKAPQPPAVPARRTILWGRSGEREIIVAAQRARPLHDSPERSRTRGVVVTLGRGGSLDAIDYHEALGDGELRRLCDEAGASGVKLEPAGLAEVAPRVAASVRRTRAAGLRLPRTYYLARDLVGCYDEHVTVAAADRVRRLRVRRRADEKELRSRAAQLMTAGDFQGARKALVRFVDAHPEDAEARSLLGTCLLELAQPELAGETLRQFAAAAHLEPDDALRRWNLASAGKRLSKAGACYLALLDYCKLSDVAQGASGRRRTARRFIHTFERFAREEHPEATPEAVARGEELFDRAYEHLRAARWQDAVSGFEAVLKLIRSHYPSWGNLGAAYACLDRREDAEHCWRTALFYKPDYEMARKNLSSMRSPM